MSNKIIKSVNNRTCLTDCVPAGTSILHPLLLVKVEEDLKYKEKQYEYYCMTNPYLDKDNDVMFYDECRKEDATTDWDYSKNKKYVTTPVISFDCSNFLALYYNIYSFADTMKWIDQNKNIPLRTKSRILNCAWAVYHPEAIDNKDSTIDFYIRLVQSHILKDKGTGKNLFSIVNKAINKLSTKYLKKDIDDKIIYHDKLLKYIIAELK